MRCKCRYWSLGYIYLTSWSSGHIYFLGKTLQTCLSPLNLYGKGLSVRVFNAALNGASGGSYSGVNFQNEIKQSLGTGCKSSLFGENKCHIHYLPFCHVNKLRKPLNTRQQKFIFVYFSKAVWRAQLISLQINVHSFNKHLVRSFSCQNCDCFRYNVFLYLHYFLLLLKTNFTSQGLFWGELKKIIKVLYIHAWGDFLINLWMAGIEEWKDDERNSNGSLDWNLVKMPLCSKRHQPPGLFK